MNSDAQTIPADIMDTASRAAISIHENGGKGWVDIIAKAILAERERCARIAEGDANRFALHKEMAEFIYIGGADGARLKISKAIRGEA
ncbi:hypothetical protein NKY44_17130 [Sinorhizobium meliloti]|jgi:hypothetical protein|uniref:hypothetical protein n=1 Tax=Rhizobium meliloti TaxID=382 RepID=UPI003D658396